MSQTETIDTLRAQLQRQAQTQQLLLEITQSIASSRTLDKALPVIAGAVQRGVGADGACIVQSGAAKASGTAGEPRAVLLSASPDILRLMAGRTVLEVPDLTADPAYTTLAAEGVKTLIALPLMAQNARHGALLVAYRSAHAFTDEERVFLNIAAGQAAIAIENENAFDAVQHSQEQLAAILASTADPVIVIDPGDVVLLINPAGERALGVRALDVIGKRIDNVAALSSLLELLRGAERLEAAEWQNEGGQTYAPRMSDITAAAAASEQERRGRVLILRDITRYKNLHANQNEFVSTVSHDLRSPLTFMQGYATMLPMVGELSPKQRDHVDKIVSGIAQMTDLIDKILDAGRLDPETGYYELARDACDVSKLANDMVTLHAQSAEKKGLTLTADIDPTLPILNLDDVMLRRALNNLVDNAIKYTPDGGAVTVTAHVVDNNLRMSVRDTGLGISEENLKHLFERFRRVRRKEHQRVKGIGLGLFIVKSVAQRHGGDAWVESKEGVGSEFIMRIPLEGANLLGAERDAKHA